MAPPKAKANAETRGTLMPTKPLASVPTDTARTAIPERVWFIQRYSIPPMRTAIMKATNRLREVVDPRIEIGEERYLYTKKPPSIDTIIPIKMNDIPKVARMESTSN
jgi:hypothetical protein